MANSPYAAHAVPAFVPIPTRRPAPLGKVIGARATRFWFPAGSAPVGIANAFNFQFRYGPEIGIDRIVGFNISLGAGSDEPELIMLESNTNWFFDRTFVAGSGAVVHDNLETFPDEIQLQFYLAQTTTRNLYISFFNYEVIPFYSGNDPSTDAPVIVNASTGNVAAGTLTALLPSAPGRLTYMTGFDLTGAGATAASVVTGSLTNVPFGPLSYSVAVPAGPTTSITPLSVRFNPPMPASAIATGITISFPSFGAGNTNSCLSAYGYHE